VEDAFRREFAEISRDDIAWRLNPQSLSFMLFFARTSQSLARLASAILCATRVQIVSLILNARLDASLEQMISPFPLLLCTFLYNLIFILSQVSSDQFPRMRYCRLYFTIEINASKSKTGSEDSYYLNPTMFWTRWRCLVSDTPLQRPLLETSTIHRETEGGVLPCCITVLVITNDQEFTPHLLVTTIRVYPRACVISLLTKGL
jgi:hypothetical protein